MTAPQHRAHIQDRVQRLEAFAFVAGADLADIKAGVEALPGLIRQEILEYTEPVFGEIMAGRGTLATKEHLDALERRLGDRIGTLDGKLDQVLAALGKSED